MVRGRGPADPSWPRSFGLVGVTHLTPSASPVRPAKGYAVRWLKGREGPPWAFDVGVGGSVVLWGRSSVVCVRRWAGDGCTRMNCTLWPTLTGWGVPSELGGGWVPKKNNNNTTIK